MAAYPHPDDIAQIIGSAPTYDDGRRVTRAVSGKPRIQTFYTAEQVEFAVVHEIYQEDLDAIIAHYDANKGTVFPFTWAGDMQTYNVMYAGSVQRAPIEGNLRSRVTVRLIVV